MKRSLSRLIASASIFATLSILFQNCGPAKVSTDSVDIASSTELGSNSDQQPDSGSNPPGSSTPVPTATPIVGSSPTPAPTPTPVQGPAMKASATSLNFGTVNFPDKSPSKIVVLTNIGTATVMINNKVVVGSDFSLDFFGNNLCGNSLAVGASCNISVYYSPFSFGRVTGVVQIVTNAPNSPLLIQLEGNSPF